MAINVLDARDTFAAPRVRVPALRLVATASTSSARRLPLTVIAAGGIGIIEAVGLLAVAVAGIDGVLTSVRPTGMALALGLSALAAWVVACAGSGAGLIEGVGRRLFMGLAYGETVLVAVLLVAATVAPVFAPPAGLPLPALALLVLAVPVGKLLLAGAPSARQWVADGPRTRVQRPDPVAAHRLLATVTLGVIGISLGALALLAPAQAPDGGPGAAASSVVYTND
ncbi:hypothetical protein E4P39_16590 [Blastococcus sp. CT_GayMR19]|uniref:hypothetical protein n=1 Tax=Blastococcus sp. CT_GayMR19 TaxID=2559608 RepID=UPI0010746FD9|nr:hypothetical protein [Blastococcus sp. CT_GayMR19]TFV72558.1 hypothetical protein E4P39_16590 [Blastococcus sp. CT_GayMR19]